MSAGESRLEDIPGLSDAELQSLEYNIMLDGGLEDCPRRALRDAATAELRKRGVHSFCSPTT